jgi:serine/threonine-protein kinase
MSQVMPRQADLLFLKLAVKNRLIDEPTARAIALELGRRAEAGKPTKARLLLVDRGLIDKETARDIKHLVRQHMASRSGSSFERRAIASYQVEERLGQGAMGVVYRARHVNLDKVVALKILNVQGDSKDVESYVKRFILEARSAAALNHPNLVQAYDVGEENGVFYLAMEYVEGENVKQLVERDGRLPEKKAVEVAVQVASALSHAHEHGLIHRDVKPSNIMLTGDGTAKLLDLGLARRVEKDKDPALTTEGRAIGTPYYMSPEQGLDMPIDHRADIYALGATLFYMVTGDVPFRAPTPQGVIAKHINERAPDPRSRVKEVSPELSRLILEMLRKDPKERPADCTAVKDALDALLDSRRAAKRSRLRSTMTSSDEKRSRDSRKGPLVPALIGTLAAAAAGLLVVTVARPSHGSTPGTTVATAPAATVSAPTPTAAPRVEETSPDPTRTAQDALERRATERLAQVEGSHTKGWELHDALDDVARAFPATRAGSNAARAVHELEGRLGLDEEHRVDEAWKAFEASSDTEKLAPIAELAEHARSDRGRDRARAKLADGEKRLEGRADELEGRARELATAEREDEAAKLLRTAAGIRKDPAKRADLARRADELDRARDTRLAGARDAKITSERARYAALCETLRERVRVHDFEKGAREAATAADAFEDGELKEKAATHALSLTSLVALDTLTLKALSGRKGDKVELGLRQGQPVSGTIASVADGRIVVRVREGIERAVAVADLDDRTTARELRRAFPNDAGVALGLAVAALYRGEGVAALAKLEPSARAKLEAIAPEVAPEPVVASKPEGDAAPISEKPHARHEPVKPEPDAKDEKKDDKKDDAADLSKLVFEKRSRIFTDADQIGWGGSRPIAWYDFLTAQRELVGRDWQTLDGRPYRAPRGSQERQGLVLDGSSGRASFEVPLQGTVRVKVVFTSQMSLKRDSLFALAFEDPKTGMRIESNLGHLSEAARGKKAGREGSGDTDAQLRLSVRDQHTLEVLIEDGVAVSKLDGREVSRLESVKLDGTIHLGLEWSRIAANLHGIEVEAMPEREFALKTLGAAPASSSPGRSGRPAR